MEAERGVMKVAILSGPAVSAARDLSAEVLLPNGHIKLLPARFWLDLPREVVAAWGHLRGTYGIPTIEIINWLREQIAGRTVIEIGAGNGDFAYHLNIQATDSYAQDDPLTKMLYKATGQPVIQYPPEVERLNAEMAVAKYQPQVVIASWVTQLFVEGLDKEGNAQAFIHGVDEIALLSQPFIETYIVIGNMDNHGRKRARRKPHSVLKPYGLVSRSMAPEKNCVFLWNK